MKFYILILFFFGISCQEKNTLFVQIVGKDSGITFNNKLVVKDTSNVLDNEFFYNGGGVAVGDLNNDGLQDIYFTGNQVPNKLYLNKGNLKFEDITEASGAQKIQDQWSSGVSMIDINADGLLDIFVCNTQHPNAKMRKNNLFINQGIGSDKIPKFKDLAEEYGLAVTQNTNSCQFFDFDKDGDLDVFMTVNELDVQYPNQYVTKIIDGSSPTHDLLYKNDFDETLNHPVFTDVSKNAGIVWPGYSHSSLIHDFNEDGWPDIYISNDYVSNDVIYINDTKGHFTNQIKHIFKHQSYSAMGSDIADINNDGLLDIFTTEMLPFSNKRKKLFIAGNSYNGYLMNDKYDYEYQYIRNTLQLNQGMNAKTGFQTFSDISFMANVHETDWSWSSLFADFDNDGYKDLYVTNGFRKDISDHDFGDYRKNASMNVSRQELYDQIPEIKVANFVFQNTQKLGFEDKTTDWGLDIPSFSNGAAYADLDNDGDLDILVNNIDAEAFLFKNTINDKNQSSKKRNDFLRIKLSSSIYKNAFETVVKVYQNSKIQTSKSLSNRGYLSASESILHFGLENKKVDSVLVFWPSGKISKINNPRINSSLAIDESSSKLPTLNVKSEEAYFNEVNATALGLDFEHMENDFIDFNFQRTLAHKYSQSGPDLSVADINNDGLDDIFIGGSSRMKSSFFIQNPSGKFFRKDVSFKTDPILKEEEVKSLLFDADADGDQDLYIVRGSYQHPPLSGLYTHVLCVNDGKGNFKVDSLAINIQTSGSCVKTADINKDGKLDLFVGGSVLPQNFPNVTPSYILLNISVLKDKPRFKDESKKWNVKDLGIVNDALLSDFDNDKLEDLIIAAEWEPIRFLKNTGKAFVDITASSGMNSTLGWWNSLCSIDFDADGDMDYVAGNYGLNTYFKASNSQPLTLYAKDFDQNKIIEPFITTYWRDSDKNIKEYYFHNRDDMTKQLPSLLKKFPSYGLFGASKANEVFNKSELAGATIKKANQLASILIKNNGKSKFSFEELPLEAQIAPIYGILSMDVNQDGLSDIVLNGNEYGMEMLQGRADAFNGLVLINNKKSFRQIPYQQSGFYVPGNGKGLAKILIKGKLHILAAQNKGKLLVFLPNKKANSFK
jgi:enediyne biosynthesis protein E4